MDRKYYQEIVNNLISKSFPKLRKRIVFLSKWKIPFLDCFADVTYFIFFSWIFVNPKMDRFPKSQVEAVLAHELAHLDIIANKNLFEKIKFGFGWIFTKKGRRNFESDADLLTIKKGYGKGLFDKVKKIEIEYDKDKLERRKSRGYFGSKEIKIYMKKFDKK